MGRICQEEKRARPALMTPSTAELCMEKVILGWKISVSIF